MWVRGTERKAWCFPIAAIVTAGYSATLLVAEYPAVTIAAIGKHQAFRSVPLTHIAGQRRGQVVAQRNPLLVVVLEREHALVGPVLVGQEFAERVGVLHRRGFHRLEAIK